MILFFRQAFIHKMVEHSEDESPETIDQNLFKTSRLYQNHQIKGSSTKFYQTLSMLQSLNCKPAQSYKSSWEEVVSCELGKPLGKIGKHISMTYITLINMLIYLENLSVE